MNFYQRLQKTCKDNGTTINGLLADLGMSPGNATNWKNGGVPSLEVLNKIAEKLKTSADYFLGRETSAQIDPTDSDIKFALFGDREIDDEVLDEVKELAAIIAERHKKKNADG